MKYCPNPARSRPVQMPLWLEPIGRRWRKRMGSRSALSAIQPSMRARWQSMPSHMTWRTKPPISLKQANPVKLACAQRHIVPADLRHQRAAQRVDEPRLAGGGPDARIALHPLHQQLEVAERQVQIHVQLAQVVEVLQAHRLQPGVEGLDDARPHLPAATIGAPHHAQVGQAARVFLQDGRVSSVDPSSTTTQSAGSTDCAATLSSVRRRYLASSRQGEMSR